MFGIVPFSIVWEMHRNSVEMQNLQGRKHLFPWEFWCMNFKTSGILPGNIWHCSIFYCLRNASEFCGNAKPSREKAFVSMRNLMHEFQNNWFLTMQHVWHCSIFYCLRNASEFCGNAKPSREKAFVSMRILMHEFQNKWNLTRQHLTLFHFLLFEKCIRILWKCKTFKGESICFHEKSNAWISKQLVSNHATFGIVTFSIVWEMHQNSVEMQNLKGRKHLFPWEIWCLNF